MSRRAGASARFVMVTWFNLLAEKGVLPYQSQRFLALFRLTDLADGPALLIGCTKRHGLIELSDITNALGGVATLEISGN